MKLIRILTSYWGGKFKDCYEKYTKPSLQYSIALLEADGYTVEWATYVGAPNTVDPLLEEIRIAISAGNWLWLAPPDTVFGSETMYNCVKLAEGKPHLIAFPHFRILEGSDIIQPPVSNSLLLDQLFHYGHSTFLNAFDTNDINLTGSGISVRQVTPKLYSVVHNLPTVYLAQFVRADYHLWESYKQTWGNHAWGRWDREWLGYLSDQNRIKVVGSSDTAIALEFTSPRAQPPLYSGMLYNDMYDANVRRPHNLIYNKLLYTLRRD